MGFFTFGINHKSCPVEIREKFSFRAETVLRALEWAKTHLDFQELVILSTCNRVEFYGHQEKDELPVKALAQLIQHTHKIQEADYLEYLYRHEERDMIRHLFRVASGLDSMVVGENEILGQLRDAFRLANQAGTAHTYLYKLMEKALNVGKAVRSETKINEGAVSVPAVAVELAEKIFGKLSAEQVMILGAGEMSALTLKNLQEAGAKPRYIVSRNAEQGNSLAAEWGGNWISFDNWESYLKDADILIASTSAPLPIVKYERIKAVMDSRKHRPLFIIDIAVPRNVEGKVNSIDDVYVYNVDDLKGVSESNIKLRHKEIRAAEALIEKAVVEYQAWLEQLKARPLIESFEQFLDSVLAQELDRLSEKSALSPEDKKEAHHRIRAKLLHPPLEKIKEASRNGGVNRYLQALHALFNLDQDKKA